MDGFCWNCVKGKHSKNLLWLFLLFFFQLPCFDKRLDGQLWDWTNYGIKLIIYSIPNSELHKINLDLGIPSNVFFLLVLFVQISPFFFSFLNHQTIWRK